MPNGYIMKKEVLEEAIANSINMCEAARRLGVPPMTFKGWAIRYGIYDPKPQERKRLEDLKSTTAVLYYLYAHDLKKHICEKCGLTETWNELPITLTLHHVDGNKKHNNIENLEILCPNCHSQTFNYSGKNHNHSTRKQSISHSSKG